VYRDRNQLFSFSAENENASIASGAPLAQNKTVEYVSFCSWGHPKPRVSWGKPQTPKYEK